MGSSSVPRQVERWDPRAIQGDVAGRIRLSEVVFSKSRGIFGLLASRDPAFGSKFSIAFRNGSELNDDEIREILKEAQSLGVDLEELAKSVK